MYQTLLGKTGFRKVRATCLNVLFTVVFVLFSSFANVFQIFLFFILNGIHISHPDCLSLTIQGMDLYFKRHDGQAVTCEEFLAAMFDANDVKFPTFPLW
jgi:hypothetical protein